MLCHVNNKQLFLIDFNDLFRNNIEHKIISTCHEHCLLKDNKLSLRNKDVKKIFLHFILKELLETILNNDSLVLFIYNKKHFPLLKEMGQYVEEGSFDLFINKIINTICLNLPFAFVVSQKTINDFCASLNNKRGEDLDTVYSIFKKIDKNKSRPNLQKAKNFIHTNQLFFINNTILNNMSNKSKLFL